MLRHFICLTLWVCYASSTTQHASTVKNGVHANLHKTGSLAASFRPKAHVNKTAPRVAVANVLTPVAEEEDDDPHRHEDPFTHFMLQHSTKREDSSDDMEEACSMVGNIADSMDDAGTLQGKKTGGAVSTATSSIKNKAKKFDKDKRQAAAEGASDGIDAASGGLLALVQGIQSGSWMDVVMGGMDLIGSLAAMMGPAGMLLSTGLAIFSMCFGLFGGATGGEESTEDMIKRILDGALLKAKADELRAESSGLKNLYSSLSKSIANYRESGAITESQAMEFYKQGFVGIPMFGILEHYISKWCDIGDANSYGEEKQSELDEQCDRCLEFTQLYCDLSILRQLLLCDMAALLSELELTPISELLLALLKKEQMSDMIFLRYMVDVINFKSQRYAAAKYYSSLEKYSTLTRYLEKLDKISMEKQEVTGVDGNELVDASSATKFIKPVCVYCTEPLLKGDCYSHSKLGNFNAADLKGWSRKAKSIQCSDNMMFTGYNDDNQKGSTYGPIYAPFSSSIYSELVSVASFTLETTTKRSTSMLKVCDKPNMDTTGECDQYEMGLHPILSPKSGDISTYEGKSLPGDVCKFPWVYKDVEYSRCIDEGDYFWCATALESDKTWDRWGKCIFPKNWNDRIESISIPAGMRVYGFELENYGGAEYGPFYGPDTMNTVLPANTWSSMKMFSTTWTTSKMVKICRMENLGGYCDHMKPSNTVNEEIMKDYLVEINGASWDSEENKMKSMKIPGGVRVTVYSNTRGGGTAYGPYNGPTTIKKLDGTAATERIRSLKIRRVY